MTHYCVISLALELSSISFERHTKRKRKKNERWRFKGLHFGSSFRAQLSERLLAHHWWQGSLSLSLSLWGVLVKLSLGYDRGESVGNGFCFCIGIIVAHLRFVWFRVWDLCKVVALERSSVCVAIQCLDLYNFGLCVACWRLNLSLSVSFSFLFYYYIILFFIYFFWKAIFLTFVYVYGLDFHYAYNGFSKVESFGYNSICLASRFQHQ